MEVLDVEDGIEGPKVLFDEEDATDASAPTVNNTWAAYRTPLVGVAHATGANQGNLSGHPVLCW
jgi:hypothetical protein